MQIHHVLASEGVPTVDGERRLGRANEVTDIPPGGGRAMLNVITRVGVTYGAALTLRWPPAKIAHRGG